MSLPTGARRSFWLGVLLILVVAGVWRATMALLLPAVSRDGVTFCWYARDLGTQGLAYLRSPDAQQHPLFPALILAVHEAARVLGAPDGPITWQRCGQFICWTAGLLVVGLSGVLAGGLVRRLALPVSATGATLLAMLAAALLDLNVWLSSDVMSEQIHLVFYLVAVILMLRLESLSAALACGVCGGLAFLTRQEGFVLVLAGLSALAAARHQVAVRPLLARAGVLLAGFLICAVPYWSTVGRFSTKKDVLEWRHDSSASARAVDAQLHVAPATNAPALARLKTLELPWYVVLPHAIYKLLRAGRVVIPLLASWPLINLRRRLCEPCLCGWVCCLGAHFALTVALLGRYGYLDARHLLVVVMLLVPFAAVLLARGYSLLHELRRPWLGVLVVALWMAPLARYALRVPNAKDGFLTAAADWLVAHDPDISSKTLLSAGSPRRTAFYANMRWQAWDDQPIDYEALVRQLRTGGPGYFAIQAAATATGAAQFEFEGNRELVQRLESDELVRPCLNLVHREIGPAGSELLIYELQPATTE